MSLLYVSFLNMPGGSFDSLQKAAYRVELVNTGVLPIYNGVDRLTDFAETAATID